MKQFILVLFMFSFAWPVVAQEGEQGEVQDAEYIVANSETIDTHQKVQDIPVFRLKDDIDNAREAKSSADMGEMVLGLMAVLAIIFALAWLSKRFNLNMPGGNTNMKMLSAMSVGQKEKIMLVEVDGEKMLLGVTPHQINVLKAFDSNVSEVVEDHAQEGRGEFASRMQSLLKAGVSQHD